MNPTSERSPGAKLGLAIVIAILLSVPLFSIWLLVYDRQQESNQAKMSIAQGYGGPQAMAGPLLVIPYRKTVGETVNEGNKPVVRTSQIWES
jgi:inner membrane protein